jgi:hypothetical protein
MAPDERDHVVLLLVMGDQGDGEGIGHGGSIDLEDVFLLSVSGSA